MTKPTAAIICIESDEIAERAVKTIELIEKILHDTHYDSGRGLIKTWCEMCVQDRTPIAQLVVQQLQNHHSDAIRSLTHGYMRALEAHAS